MGNQKNMKRIPLILFVLLIFSLHTNAQSLIDDAKARNLIKLAEEVLQQGAFSKSITYYEQADSLSSTVFTSGDYNNMAGVYYNLKDYDKAVRICKKAIARDTLNYQSYVNLGIAYTALDSTRASIAAYEKAKILNPQIKIIYFNLGTAYSKLKEYQSAIVCYEQLLAIDSNDSKAYVNMGIAYAELGNHEKLFECFEKAAKMGDKEAQEFLSKTKRTWE